MGGSTQDRFYSIPYPSNTENIMKKINDNKPQNLKFSAFVLNGPVRKPIYSSLDIERRFPELKDN